MHRVKLKEKYIYRERERGIAAAAFAIKAAIAQIAIL